MAYVQLGEICNVVKGEIGITKAIPGDYPMVTTAEFRKSHNKFQLDTKAVLVPLVSATGHGHASIKRVHYQEGKFAFGSILAACVPKDESYSAKFLYIYFNLMKDFVLVPLMKGSANVSLTLGNLKKAKVPNISLETQLKIVELYSKIKIEQDKATDLLVRQEADINSLKQCILQEAVQGKLTADWRINNPDSEDASVLLKRIQKEKAQLVKDKKIKKEKGLPAITEEEIPYELPVGWVWCRFQNIINELKGGGTPSKANPQFWNGKLPWASVKDLKDFRYLEKTKDFITKEGLEKSSSNLIPANSLIICTRMGLGKIAINKIPVTINQDLKAVSLSNKVDIQFIYDQYKTKTIVGTGVTVSGIKQEELLGFLFAIPPLEEQKAIVQKVNALMGLCDTLEQEVQQSQAHSEMMMQSVLRAVFEGE